MKHAQLSQRLVSLGTAENAEKAQRFFKTAKGEYGEGDRFLGVRVPILRKVAVEFQQMSLTEVRYSLRSDYHEERLCALFILVRQFERGNQQQQERVCKLYLSETRYINNWDLVDSSAYKILGAYLLKRDRAPLYKLVVSNSLWERRIAIIATYYFIKNGQFEDTLEIAQHLLNDDEDLIHKAVGWMLREVANKNQGTTERFLNKHYKNMPRTMLRYAIEKFPETLRQAYLSGKV
jgi:3-methyladenine DNA glycosylase AlkD